MPENDKQAVMAGAKAPAETALAKFEREQLTRRQALRKFGVTSAMATFALFSVDDLARMVGKAMQQRAGDNKVAEQLAKEFQQAGIAMAGGTDTSSCAHCCNQRDQDLCSCISLYGSQGFIPDESLFKSCMNDLYYSWSNCMTVPGRCPDDGIGGCPNTTTPCLALTAA